MFPTTEQAAERRSRFPAGARVRAVRFSLDEGLRIWPIQTGVGAGWRLVRVTGQRDEDVTELARRPAQGARFELDYPDATYGINDNETVPPGTEGTVTHSDGVNVGIQWDNGRSLNLGLNDVVELVA